MKATLLYCLLFATGTFAQSAIQTSVYRQPTYDGTTNVEGGTISDSDKSITTEYLDGLGRPVQTTIRNFNTNGKNAVIQSVFDGYGNLEKSYFPLPDLNYDAYTDPSVLKPNIEEFYQFKFPDEGSNPFVHQVYENTLGGRLLQKANGGRPWSTLSQGGDGHTFKYEYGFNVAANEEEKIVRFVLSRSYDSAVDCYVTSLSLASPGYYTNNTLKVRRVRNENWVSGKLNTTEEYFDGLGRKILRRAFNNQSKPIDTYYIYDDIGNLCYVIPPLGEATVNVAELDEIAYQYRFDKKNRLVMKKLPGKAWEYFAYDSYDRVFAYGPVLSPFDGLAQGWYITKYDEFNRVAYSGYCNSVTAFDAKLRFDFQSANSGVVNEHRVASNIMDGFTIGYSNDVFPTSVKLLAVNYYDDYVFPDMQYASGSILGQTPASSVRGALTGSMIRLLTSDDAEKKYVLRHFLYDERMRVIARFDGFDDGLFDEYQYLYAFDGSLLKTVLNHKKDGDAIRVEENFTYYENGLLKNRTHKIDNGDEEILSRNYYDELNNLQKKEVGGADPNGSDALQYIDYSRNIRGWLTHINDPEILGNDLFALRLNYNQKRYEAEGSYATHQLFNGNVSEVMWRTQSDNVLRMYGLRYDNLNRLTQATYMKPIAGDPNITNAYDESAQYDKNGNIVSLVRNGHIDATPFDLIEIDNLQYNYNPKSNKLLDVEDSSMCLNGFYDGNTDVNYHDFEYDSFGNLTKDRNKGIQKITYNHLNLPVRVTFENNAHIDFFYDALGQLYRRVVSAQEEVSTEYRAGFHYQNNRLLFIHNAEGYTKVNEDRYNYVYNYTDHLGNNRLSYTAKDGDLIILEENNYYPFGLKHENYNVEKADIRRVNGTFTVTVEPVDRLDYQYKFQGQEYIDALNLNLYNFQWRKYDPAIGRFSVIDPLTEKYNWMSTYQFASNQVMHAPELEGLESANDLSYNENDEVDQGETIDIPLANNIAWIYRLEDVEVKSPKKAESEDSQMDVKDQLDYIVGGGGELNGVLEKSWKATPNQAKWKAAYQISQTFGTRTSTVKNAIAPILRNTGRTLTGAAYALTIYNVVSTGKVNSSDLLNVSMTALGSTGFGAPIAGVYFVADLLTFAITQKSIGQHLDEAVGGPILDLGYGHK